VRLSRPAQYATPYVKRGKNDAADAEAICEAVTRPTMRFVGIKTPEQQSAMMLGRVSLILNRQRAQLSNALRATWLSSGWWRQSAGTASISYSTSSLIPLTDGCRLMRDYAWRCWLPSCVS
jgi:transposase